MRPWEGKLSWGLVPRRDDTSSPLSLVSDLFNLFVAIKSKELYVILMKDDQNRLTLLADPGVNKPWSSTNKKLADYHAKECNGEARTFAEAWQLLLKDNPNFERELMLRVENRDVARAMDPKPIDPYHLN